MTNVDGRQERAGEPAARDANNIRVGTQTRFQLRTNLRPILGKQHFRRLEFRYTRTDDGKIQFVIRETRCKFTLPAPVKVYGQHFKLTLFGIMTGAPGY